MNVSVRQLKTIQLVHQGLSLPRAMKQAGYADTTSRQTSKFRKRKAIRTILANLPNALTAVGLDSPYIADKVKEQLEAMKIHSSHTEPDKEVPDNQARLKAIEIWYQMMKEGENAHGEIRRRMTIEEFVNTEKEETAKQEEEA